MSSAAVFGIAHLPAAALMGDGLTPATLLAVVADNLAFGLVAGWLFRRFGLEAAILAHAVAHLVLVGLG